MVAFSFLGCLQNQNFKMQKCGSIFFRCCIIFLNSKESISTFEDIFRKCNKPTTHWWKNKLNFHHVQHDLLGGQTKGFFIELHKKSWVYRSFPSSETSERNLSTILLLYNTTKAIKLWNVLYGWWSMVQKMLRNMEIKKRGQANSLRRKKKK